MPQPTAPTRASSSPTTRSRSPQQIGAYTELGFTHLVFHAPGEDQRRFLDQFCADVVPLLR